MAMRLIKRHGQGPLKEAIFSTLPHERASTWLQTIEMRGLNPALKSRNLYAALNWHWLTGALRRRRHKITGRWEYARAAKNGQTD